MPRRPIPFARSSSHFLHIQNNLALVLSEIKNISNDRPNILWVSCRLNRTGTQDQPVFVGWLEDIEAINLRIQRGHPYPPAEIRFSDSHPSQLYHDCLKAAVGSIVTRNWDSQKPDATSQQIGRKFYGEKARRSAPIKIGRLYVGTLNTAYLEEPGSKEENRIKRILLKWAQDTNSPLIKYIKSNLAFSRLRHP